MAKRSKDSQPKAPKAAPFNNPFTGLKVKREPPPPPVKAAPPPRPAPVPSRGQSDDDAELFLQAMDGVVPVKQRGPEPQIPQISLPRRVSDDAEALASLAELVSTEGPFELASSDASIEGAAAGLDPRILRSLRRGDYPVQAKLDLHGFTQVTARDAVEQFVARSRREGKRCVLIVHGRGLNSPDQQPVLKDGVQRWLSSGKAARGVLAFTSARPEDGGAGAVYVLLRKGRG